MLQRTFVFALALLITVATARAQNAPGEQRGAAGVQAQTPGAAGLQGQVAPGQPAQLDQPIATCLALGNLEEIALAQFAEGRLQNERAKEFAQTMIRDHQQAFQRLQQIAPQVAGVKLQTAGTAGRTGQPGTATAANGAQPGQTTGAVAAGRTALNANSAQPPEAALARAIAEKCLQLTQQELGEHQGWEFDMAYIGQQCVAHTQMLAKLQASEQFASPELRPFIADATKTVEHHRTMAKEVKETLKAEAGQAGARQAAQPRQPATGVRTQ